MQEILGKVEKLRTLRPTHAVDADMIDLGEEIAVQVSQEPGYIGRSPPRVEAVAEARLGSMVVAGTRRRPQIVIYGPDGK